MRTVAIVRAVEITGGDSQLRTGAYARTARMHPAGCGILIAAVGSVIRSHTPELRRLFEPLRLAKKIIFLRREDVSRKERTFRRRGNLTARRTFAKVVRLPKHDPLEPYRPVLRRVIFFPALEASALAKYRDVYVCASTFADIRNFYQR